MANDQVSDLGFDAQNNVYFAGAFNYSITFDGVTDKTSPISTLQRKANTSFE
jgi:hypothetical protein